MPISSKVMRNCLPALSPTLNAATNVLGSAELDARQTRWSGSARGTGRFATVFSAHARTGFKLETAQRAAGALTIDVESAHAREELLRRVVELAQIAAKHQWAARDRPQIDLQTRKRPLRLLMLMHIAPW